MTYDRRHKRCNIPSLSNIWTVSPDQAITTTPSGDFSLLASMLRVHFCAFTLLTGQQDNIICPVKYASTVSKGTLLGEQAEYRVTSARDRLIKRVPIQNSVTCVRFFPTTNIRSRRDLHRQSHCEELIHSMVLWRARAVRSAYNPTAFCWLAGWLAFTSGAFNGIDMYDRT